MKLIRALAALAVLVTAGAAFAHSYLAQSSPANGDTLTVLPKTVRLEFTEPVEVAFSKFKLYRLEGKANDSKTAEREADSKLEQWLNAKNDEAIRADAGTTINAGAAARLEVKLKDKLEPGWYALVWRVLSVDTHTSSGQVVFRYKP